MTFHNPYHFIPSSPGGSLRDMDAKVFGEGPCGHVTHERYVTSGTGADEQSEPCFSGRLLCRLTTESATVVGGEHIPGGRDAYTQVIPFMTAEEEPAIPDSSLRGLLASLAEAASNSTLRVLENERLSVRRPVQEALPYLGMIVHSAGQTDYSLRPLALGHYPVGTNAAGVPRLSALDRALFPDALLRSYVPMRVYLNRYQTTAANQPAEVEVVPRTFLADPRLTASPGDNRQFWYMRLEPSLTCVNGSIEGQGLHRSSDRTQTYYTVTAREGLGNPIDATEYEQLKQTNPTEAARYTRGLLRVLGIAGRAREIPATKKHELFVPYPEGAEDMLSVFDATAAVQVFHALADQRTSTDDSLPFHLQGSQQRVTIVQHKKPKPCVRLRDGDLVFFRATQIQGTVQIDEVAISAIWRRVVDGTTHEFFSQIDPELLPMHPARKKISLAEQLFGFVEDGKKGRTLAGRVRFSTALPAPGQENPWLPSVPLKILASPKPPSPALYFRHQPQTAGNGPIRKQTLNKAEHWPQGRKHYLHSQAQPVSDDAQAPPWKTQHPQELKNQKAQVTPLRSGLRFYFHIDCDNLSATELGLLLYCLQPSDTFRHKLGMGKPIGLGRVRLEPVGWFAVNRGERYRAKDIFAVHRYASYWLATAANEQGGGPADDEWKARYGREAECLEQGRENKPLPENWAKQLRDAVAGQVQQRFPDIQRAITRLGEPQHLQAPVHYPQVDEPGVDLERKLFKWFVQNEKTGQQYLKPITEGTSDIDQLDRNP
ncbi:MAG: CRISPR-associated RAMP family protein [Desulfobulbaceae bacterium A2]|nr:MAG: CRISPR-associated RAMP family protein [Desulfobulbaceae bacterium A2]